MLGCRSRLALIFFSSVFDNNTNKCTTTRYFTTKAFFSNTSINKTKIMSDKVKVCIVGSGNW